MSKRMNSVEDALERRERKQTNHYGKCMQILSEVYNINI